MQGVYCKALSLENCQFLGKTLSVLLQDLNKNINTPSHRVGGIIITNILMCNLMIKKISLLKKLLQTS